MVSIINEKLTFVIKYGEVTEKKNEINPFVPNENLSEAIARGCS